jgi:serine/threonine-protein kinase
VGTPHFMAPEQWRGDQVDERTDVYGIGATLFKLLCGRAPHEGSRPTRRASSHACGELRASSGENAALLRSVVPKELAEVVFRALEIRPQDRIPTAGDFADAVAKWCGAADLPALVRRVRDFEIVDTLHDSPNSDTTRPDSQGSD